MSSAEASTEYDRSEPVVVVSNDTHIGPRLVEDLRAYCPTKHLDDFDRFAASTAKDKADAAALLERQRLPRPPQPAHRRPPRPGRSARRLRPRRHRSRRHLPRLDEHGADPVHLRRPRPRPRPMESPDLAGVGMSIYNRWLADFVARGTASTRRTRLPPDVGRRRRGRRGRVGARGRTARRELPRHARRRTPRVQPVGLGTALGGVRGARHAARHPRRRRHGRSLLEARRRRPPAVRVGERSRRAEPSGG